MSVCSATGDLGQFVAEACSREPFGLNLAAVGRFKALRMLTLEGSTRSSTKVVVQHNRQ